MNILRYTKRDLERINKLQHIFRSVSSDPTIELVQIDREDFLELATTWLAAQGAIQVLKQ